MDEVEYLKRKIEALHRVALERWPNHKIDEKVEEYMKLDGYPYPDETKSIIEKTRRECWSAFENILKEDREIMDRYKAESSKRFEKIK